MAAAPTSLFDRIINDLEDLLTALNAESSSSADDPPFLTEADQHRELALAAIDTLLPALRGARSARVRASRPLMQPPLCEHCE